VAPLLWLLALTAPGPVRLPPELMLTLSSQRTYLSAPGMPPPACLPNIALRQVRSADGTDIGKEYCAGQWSK
jgi:hypothetical protein